MAHQSVVKLTQSPKTIVKEVPKFDDPRLKLPRVNIPGKVPPLIRKHDTKCGVRMGAAVR